MRPDLSRSLAANLQQRIAQDPSRELPSINDLARENAVAYQTMWKAVQILIKKGFIVCPRGKKISVAPLLRPGTQESLTSAEEIACRIRNRVLSAQYRAGHALPKVSFFALEAQVGQTTVTRALRVLESEKLVHKRKARWFAGPPPAQRSILTRPDQAPVILVLFSDYADWSLSLRSSFVAKFLTPFFAETAGHGIRLIPAMREPYPHQALDIPAGITQVKSAIRSFKDRYLGCLALAQFPKKDRFENWLAPLCSLGKPIVYFDNTDTGEYLARSFLNAGKSYYRFHFDENAAVKLALSRLHVSGHRVIGIHGASLADWMERRLDRIVAHARELDPSLRIAVSGPAEAIWGELQESEISFVTSSVARKAGIELEKGDADRKDRERFCRLLSEETASLASLIRDEKPTAIMAMNDYMAREYFFWFKALGYEIPGDFSLVGFDNQSEAVLFPLSTIDFGFSRLGYLAVHALMGDLPIRADRQGNVPGPCEFIDRGSIGTV